MCISFWRVAQRFSPAVLTAFFLTGLKPERIGSQNVETLTEADRWWSQQGMYREVE
jgi:hypothetical protein